MAVLSSHWLCAFSREGLWCGWHHFSCISGELPESPITSLQVVINCDAPEIDIIFIEGVLLCLPGPLSFLHPPHPAPVKLTWKLHTGKYCPSLGLAIGNQTLTLGIFEAGVVGVTDGLCVGPYISS